MNSKLIGLQELLITFERVVERQEQDCMKKGKKRKQLLSEKDADKTMRNNNRKYEEG